MLRFQELNGSDSVPFPQESHKRTVSQQALTSSLLKNKYLCKLREEDSRNLFPKAQMAYMSQTKIKSTNSLMKYPSPEAAVLRGRCAEELSASQLLSPLWWWGPQCRHPARHLYWCLCPGTEWGGGQLKQENRLGVRTGPEFHSVLLPSSVSCS